MHCHILFQRNQTKLSARRMSSLRYFNSGDAFRKKTSKARDQEKPDGWKNVEGVVHHQGLSYVPQII